MLGTINLVNNFILYCNAEVTYIGRARSESKNGNYLVIHKRDGSLVIHNAENCKPMNYQTKKSILSVDGNTLVSKSKSETILVKVNRLDHHYELDDWCSEPIVLTGSEYDLREKFIVERSGHASKLYKEFKTPIGNIDLLIIDFNNVYEVLEFKRNKASLAGCSQLKRYVDYIAGTGKVVRGYLVAPSISRSALAYLRGLNLEYVKFTF